MALEFIRGEVESCSAGARPRVDLPSVVNVWKVCHQALAPMPLWQVLETLHSTSTLTVVRAVNEDGVECLLSLYEAYEGRWLVHEMYGGLCVLWEVDTRS